MIDYAYLQHTTYFCPIHLYPSNNADNRHRAFRNYNIPNSTLDLLKSVLYSLQMAHFKNKDVLIFTRRMLCHCLFIYLLVKK